MDVLAGKRLLILGMARQGTALARFATGVGAQVTVTDMRSREQLAEPLAQLADIEIDTVLGGHPMSLLEQADVVAISGGVPADAPFVNAARERGLEVTNDSQEFLRRAKPLVIGITGSAGKTTTTALTGLMAQLSGRTTWVGGNIGRPLIADLHKMGADDLVVQELSSFQLEIWTASPPIAAITNITPNHLDRHKTMVAYANAKGNILRGQGPDGIAVLGLDDPGARAMERVARGRVRWFSLNRPVTDGAYLRGDTLVLVDENGERDVCDRSDIQLRGDHNVRNVLAALCLADSANVPLAAMQQAIRSFTGVEHRLEHVATIDGVQYINDSIATSPERSLAALDSFNEPIVLLAGGRDKDMVWDTWARRVREQVKAVVLFGELAPLLERKLAGNGDGLRNHRVLRALRMLPAADLAEAVRIASDISGDGDVVLLSPGGTSFDAYHDFAARGVHFRALVQELDG